MEEKPKNFKVCDICGAQAIFLCLECLANYYCDSCYKLIHDKKEKNNHKKEKLDYFIPIDTRCPKHPKVSLESNIEWSISYNIPNINSSLLYKFISFIRIYSNISTFIFIKNFEVCLVSKKQIRMVN